MTCNGCQVSGSTSGVNDIYGPSSLYAFKINIWELDDGVCSATGPSGVFCSGVIPCTYKVSAVISAPSSWPVKIILNSVDITPCAIYIPAGFVYHLPTTEIEVSCGEDSVLEAYVLRDANGPPIKSFISTVICTGCG